MLLERLTEEAAEFTVALDTLLAARRVIHQELVDALVEAYVPRRYQPRAPLLDLQALSDGSVS